jgi:type IV pilus assembly protein PilW
MNYIFQHRYSGAARRQSGFTLIEVMVSVTISVFLLGGLLTVVQQTRNTYTAQVALAQLQDSERLAMTLMTDVIQSAGYFPNPTVYTAAGTMPVSPAFATAGSPTVLGQQDPTVQGDTITVRYAVAQNDSVFNCRGETNTLAPYDTWENTFSVNANGSLVCNFTSITNGAAAAAPLVTGLQNMTIWYGVNTTGGITTCADRYLRANAVTAGNYWPNVCSVKVRMTFTNPLNPPNGPQPTITFTRVIGVLNKAGVG